jgi:signal transduction histidine kinase
MSHKRELDSLLAFLNFSAEDEDALRDLEPILEENADGLVQAFYRHLLAFEETRGLLADPLIKQRLLAKQRDYLLGLSSVTIDDAYLDERRHLGETHLRIGLAPRWYLGAYSLYFSLLLPLVCEEYRTDPDRAERTATAIVKRLILDAQLAMEAYIQGRQQQLDHLNRELAATSRDLERRYAEQVTELRRTARRARAAEELASVATLVSGLAHEIGTPMNVIQGHAELLEASLGDERARRRLRTIQEQIDRISNIIQTLLSVARPRDPIRTRVNLRELLEATLEFTAERLRRNRIEVAKEFQEVPEILGDPEKLQQLLLNLVLNAADAMQEGGKLELRLAPTAEESVEIRVADTGIGIESERLRQIFDPFHTTKPAGRGSGLGLTVARGIVSDHDGTIEVQSEAGSGTEFRVLLPANRPASR